MFRVGSKFKKVVKPGPKYKLIQESCQLNQGDDGAPHYLFYTTAKPFKSTTTKKPAKTKAPFVRAEIAFQTAFPKAVKQGAKHYFDFLLDGRRVDVKLNASWKRGQYTQDGKLLSSDVVLICAGNKQLYRLGQRNDLYTHVGVIALATHNKNGSTVFDFYYPNQFRRVMVRVYG